MNLEGVINSVQVHTSDNGGLPLETLAQIAGAKIINTIALGGYTSVAEGEAAVYPIVLEYLNRAVKANY